MKLASLFSGGKDSTYALYQASKEHEVVCLLSVVSENPESYMFHTPNISMTELQSESLGIPLISKITKGVKEEELEDLKELIKEAIKKYNIEGIITGAIASDYQASRIQKICDELSIKCINPLWRKDQIKLVKDMIKDKFQIMVVAVSCEGLTQEWLGKTLDKNNYKKLEELSEKYKFNPAFEGGEAETLVINCPLFKKRLNIIKARKDWWNSNGVYMIEEAELI